MLNNDPAAKEKAIPSDTEDNVSESESAYVSNTSETSVSEILSQASIAEEDGEEVVEDNAQKRKHMVKTNK